MLLDGGHRSACVLRIWRATAQDQGGARTDLPTWSTRGRPLGFVTADSGEADQMTNPAAQGKKEHFCAVRGVPRPCDPPASMRPPTILRTTIRRGATTPLRPLSALPRPIPPPTQVLCVRAVHHTAPRLNTASPPKAKQCPSCGSHLAPSASPCPSCKALVPIPSDVSYYALFDLVPPASDVKHQLTQLEGGGYVLDVRDLRMRYLKRQQGCHPDSYTGQGKVGVRPILFHT